MEIIWPGPAAPFGHVQKAIVKLSNADIKALPSTAYTILPPPGNGKVYLWYKVIFVADKTAGAYSLTGDLRIGIEATSNGQIIGGLLNEDLAEAYPLIGNGNTDKVMASLGNDKYIYGGDGSTLNNFENIGIEIFTPDTGTVVTGGNINNYLKATIFYSIFAI